MAKTSINKPVASSNGSSKILAARLRAALNFPYFSGPLFSMHFVEVPGLTKQAGGFIACDEHYRVYFDPEEVEKQEVSLLVTAFYHELGHLLRGHHKRASHYLRMKGLPENKNNMQALNLCEDAEINDEFPEVRDKDGKPLVIPSWQMTPEKLGIQTTGKAFPDGLLFEQYADMMPNNGKKSQDSGEGDPADGEGEGDGNSCDGDNASQDGDISDKSGKPLRGQNCGSAARGKPQPWEIPADNKDVPAVSRAEAEILERQVAREIQEFIANPNSRGTVPGSWRRWADLKLEIPYDPKKDLESSVRYAMMEIQGKLNYTWRKFSRRSDGNVCLPGMSAPIPNVAILADTSASMSQKAIAEGMALVHKILKQFNCAASVDVVVCDAAVHSAKKVFKASQVQLAGGGGTDMRVGLAEIVERKPRPHVVFCFTDGGTPWPENPLGVKFVIAMAGDDTTTLGLPDYAKVVWLNGKPKKK